MPIGIITKVQNIIHPPAERIGVATDRVADRSWTPSSPVWDNSIDAVRTLTVAGKGTAATSFDNALADARSAVTAGDHQAQAIKQGGPNAFEVVPVNDIVEGTKSAVAYRPFEGTAFHPDEDGQGPEGVGKTSITLDKPFVAVAGENGWFDGAWHAWK